MLQKVVLLDKAITTLFTLKVALLSVRLHVVLDSELLLVNFVAEEALEPVFLVVGDRIDIDDSFGAGWHNSLPF